MILTLCSTGTTLNVMSLMGVVMLVGIAVSNSILIVEFTRHLREEGMAVREAVAMACRVRLRPVLMTSLATIIGLLPMALKLGAGSEAYAPLARAILGGLTVSVVLTVFLVPAAYVLVYGIGLWPVQGPKGRAARRRRPRMTRRLLTPLLLLPASLQAQQPMHLTLADAQHIAIQNNPQYSSAKFNAAAVHQEAAQYRAAELPSMTGLLTGVGADDGSRLAAGALNNPTVYSRAAGGIVASQLITDFGRTHNLVGMSNLQAQAQDQASENTRADVLLAATRGYFDVLRAQAVLKVAQQTVAARQLVFDQISALAQSQLRTELDVSFANVNLSDAKLLQLQAENGINSAEAELAAALGLPNQTTFDVADEPMPAALPAQADPLIAQAMQNRPDLKDLQLLQSAAERFTRAEHDLYYPTVSALAAAGGVPAGVSQVPDHYAAAGINVNIPIFNGGLFQGTGIGSLSQSQGRRAERGRSRESHHARCARRLAQRHHRASTRFADPTICGSSSVGARPRG